MLTLLKDSNVDGIITTNWDTHLEGLFPAYRVFVGQEELLFSNPSGVAEIYKIHGCCTRSNSLILTSEDYAGFERKYAYLAAKLFNIFIEHPVFFIGYSISDPNIREILESIVGCIGASGAIKLQNRLVVIEWSANAPSFQLTHIRLQSGTSVPITLIQTNDFSPVYAALSINERKLPLKVLRYCKEQLYDLILNVDKTKQLHVTSLDDADSEDNIEFVVGVGVIGRLGLQGYKPIGRPELLHDILFDDGKFDPQKLLKQTIPLLQKGRSVIPFYKYLQAIKVASDEKYRASGLMVHKKFKPPALPKLSNALQGALKDKTFKEILKIYDVKHVMQYLHYLRHSNIDINTLGDFLRKELPNQDQDQMTWMNKSVWLYDRLKYGWDSKVFADL